MKDLIETDHTLTEKQAAFCREYLIDKNGSAAAIRAGYSENTSREIAWQLLQKPHVRAFMDQLLLEQQARTNISADYVLLKIYETLERCAQEVVPLRDKKGQHVEVETKDGEFAKAYTFDSKGVLKAAELLGRHLKMFTDISEQKHTFTQMGRVLVGSDGTSNTTDAAKALEFNVGSPARDPHGIIEHDQDGDE